MLDAFWRLESWPTVAPHVLKIDMLYEDAQVQVLRMTVQSRGRTDVFKTVRILQGNAIFYYQPEPPPFLRRHYGWWEVASEADATIITSRHEVDFHLDVAQRYLAETGATDLGSGAVVPQMLELIRNNSLQTMLGLKRRMEGSQEVTHAAR
ncbi:hypothetical protein [Corallococcus sp. EGB]|uniref:hypothetical protein n=1 Tax=Corallococcus sp. EGB TaxID=1521117 RepID=UPI001CC0DB9D|nr:hypothetical protein [Corallococcus sp. EGB]